MKWILFMLIGALVTAKPECTCIPNYDHIQWIEQEFEKSEVVFIGESKRNKQLQGFHLKVIKCFKGNLSKGTMLESRFSYEPCIPEIRGEGRWILYGNIKDGRFYSNECGMSRPFEKPVLYPLPVPILPEEFARDSIAAKEKAKLEMETFYKDEGDRLCFEIAYLKELSKKQ